MAGTPRRTGGHVWRETVREEVRRIPVLVEDAEVAGSIGRINRTPVIRCLRCGFWRDGRYVFPTDLWKTLGIPEDCDAEIVRRVLMS